MTAITLDTHRWNCQACGGWGTVEMTPVLKAEAVFDPKLWAKENSHLIGHHIYRDREYHCLFGFPEAILDELTEFRYPSRGEAVKALERAAVVAHKKGWAGE